MARQLAQYDDVPKPDRKASGLPPMPPMCGVQDCQCDAWLMSVTVRDGGRIRTGPPSNFGKLPAHKGEAFSLDPRYTFVEWHPRCYDHFLREQSRAGKDRFAPIRAMDKPGALVTSPLNDDRHVCDPEMRQRIVDEKRRRHLELMDELGKRVASPKHWQDGA